LRDDNLQLDDEESTAGSMKKSFSTLLGQVNEVLNPQPDDEDEEAMVIQGSEPVSLSPFQVIFKFLFHLSNCRITMRRIKILGLGIV
jgi:hypothetical protein